MKLSTNTVNILKNFTTINEGIFIKKGKVLETISKQKNILARAEVDDEFDDEFGVYDLNNFLGVLSLQKGGDTEINFDDKNILIKGFSGKSQMKYRKAAKEMIVVPPDKKINMANPEVSFNLSAEEIAWVTRVANQLSSPNLAFISDGTTVEIQSYDAKDDASHVNTTELSSAGNGRKYKMIFATDNLKFIEGSYDVQISAKGISHFKHTTLPVEYWVMAETGSKVE